MNKRSLLKHVSWMALYISMMAIKPTIAMEDDSDQERRITISPTVSDDEGSSSSPSTEKKSNPKKRLGEPIDKDTPVDDSKKQTDKHDDSNPNKKPKAREKIPEEDAVTISHLSGDVSSSPSREPSTIIPLTTAKRISSFTLVPSALESSSAPGYSPQLPQVDLHSLSTDPEKMEVTPSSVSQLPAKGKETFYLFNVGQGNSQLAIYNEELDTAFGVLYDCGSAAKTEHPKIVEARSIDQETLFLKKTHALPNPNTNPQPSSTTSTNKDKETSSSSAPKPLHPLSSSGGSETSYDDERREIVNAAENVKKTIAKHNLAYLFVFLSHPDKDHINLISQVIPEKQNALFILCGNFLQPSENDEKRLKEGIQDLFEFMKNRRSSALTDFCLPYFWNFSRYLDLKKKIQNYNKPKKNISKDILTIDRELLDLYDQTWGFEEGSLPFSLYGSFSDFLSTMLTYDSDMLTTFQSTFTTFLTQMTENEASGENHLISFASSSRPPEIKTLLQHEKVKKNLDNIYIWALNKISTNINTQSSVVSFRMPKLQTSIVCTGDVDEDLWSDLQSVKTSQARSSKGHNHHSFTEALDDSQNTILLMLPHHGSYENWSPIMLTLVNPHMLGISAGAGMHGHPSNNLIKKYYASYIDQASLKERLKEIGERYSVIGSAYRFMSFKSKKTENNKGEKTQKEYKVYRHRLEQGDLPILCTNLLGTIAIKEEGIVTQHSSQITWKNMTYEINFQTRAAIPSDDTVVLPEPYQKIIYPRDQYIYQSLDEKSVIVDNTGAVYHKEVDPNTGRSLYISSTNSALILIKIEKDAVVDDKKIAVYYKGNKIQQKAEENDEKMSSDE